MKRRLSAFPTDPSDTPIELLVVPRRTSGNFSRRQSAFTLIELLVVIAIISILNAMLMPAFSTAIDRANQETCQTRLRELSLATKIYFEEHGQYPPSLQSLYDGHYIDDDAVLRCVKTGKPYVYARPAAEAGRGSVLFSCVATATPRGKRPHFFGDAFALARSGGKVEVQRQ